MERDDATAPGERSTQDDSSVDKTSTNTDRFRRGVVLGRGGTGEVVEAQDVTLERVVAVKSLQPKYAKRQEMRLRFLHEAHIMASLDHPGSVPIYELGVRGDEIFYAMKRVRGQTLRKILRARRREGIRNRSDLIHFVDLFERVCDTVAYAHDQGIIHRDLKPENVMVDENEAVYLMDWGLAKRLGEDSEPGYETRTGVLVGTPAYMSPEQARGQGKEAEYAADVFALGTLLYEILTGHRPFGGASTREILEGVLYERPEDPRKLNAHVPRALEAITLKALNKDPARRYLSAREMVRDVRAFREYRPVTAFRPGWPDRLSYWVRRSPRLATAMISAAVALVLAGALLGYRFYLDQHFEGLAAQRLAKARLEIRSLDRVIAEVEKRKAEAPDVQVELDDLYLRRNLEQAAANQMLAALLGRSLFKPDPLLLADARESAIAAIRFDYEAGRDYAVELRAEKLLENIREDNILAYTKGEVAEVEELLRQARERRLDKMRPPAE